MNVQIKSSAGITLIPIETRLLAERKIFIEGEINHETAIGFIKQMLFLTNENDELPIDVFINSPGGEIKAGLLIYDAISSSPVPGLWNSGGNWLPARKRNSTICRKWVWASCRLPFS